MTCVMLAEISTKEIFSRIFSIFLLICLHLHLIDHIKKQTSDGKEIFFTVSFTSLNIFFKFFTSIMYLEEQTEKLW